MEPLPPPRRNFLIALGLAVAVVLRITRPQARRVPPPPVSPVPPDNSPSSMPTTTGDALSARGRVALLARLRRGRPSPVWLAAPSSSPSAVRLANSLSDAFMEAGWDVKTITQLDWVARPGFYLYAADPTPPSYFEDVRAALEAAGFQLTVGVDYRAFFNERRAQTGWRGVEMTPDQTWVLLIGRRD